MAERCAASSCAGSKLNPILQFDASGRLVRRFGEAMFLVPHGIHVDREGNVWVTDAAANEAGDRVPREPNKGHVVYKFSPEGRVLLRLGEPGVAGDGGGRLLNEPCDVVTAPNGDIFVAEGHSGQQPGAPPNTVARIATFTSDGTFVKAWGRFGSGPGEFKTPHGLAFDAAGRLFVADRGNNRIQIFTRDGRFLEERDGFGRPSGIFIDGHDVLYVADSESDDAVNRWERGIRIGRASGGAPMYFISQPGIGAEGVAADSRGNIYGAAVGAGARALTKYVRR